jgi:hypothetical protein
MLMGFSEHFSVETLHNHLNIKIGSYDEAFILTFLNKTFLV